MKRRLSVRLWALFLLPTVLLLPPKGISAQQDKVAALKQSLAQNQKRLAQYQWIETTVISMKGDEKSRVQKQCLYGPDGKVQKQQISAPAQEQSKRGLRGKIVEKKKGEITDYMQQAVALVHQYVPPDLDRIQAAKDSGKLSVSPLGPNAARLDFRDFVKPGDSLSLTIDTENLTLQKAAVKSYLDSPDDLVTLDVSFLIDGVSYPANCVLNAPAKNIQVVIQNSNYKRMTGGLQAPSQKPQGMQSAVAQGHAAPDSSPRQIQLFAANRIALFDTITLVIGGMNDD